MELKLSEQENTHRQGGSSNRTFMELKWKLIQAIIMYHSVLIVPLWNWNRFLVVLAKEIESSNRTFMELKLPATSDQNEEKICSNRTFMELK